MSDISPLHILLGSIVSQIILFIALFMVIYVESSLQTSSSLLIVILAIEGLLTALDIGLIYSMIKGASD